jgi:integrase
MIRSYHTNASQYVHWCREHGKVDKYLDRLGLKSQGISCHSLRHSAATWARVEGDPFESFQQRPRSSLPQIQNAPKVCERITLWIEKPGK